MTGFSLHYSPILLSIICLLVREEDINLVQERFEIGDLFLRMVRCLFQKFSIRNRTKFTVSSFIQAMKSVGKLALKTLVADYPFMQRSQVIEEIGEEAFDYGLLIGQEDFRLIRNDATDIIITFSHRSLQEFLGALFFILGLGEGESVEGLLGFSQKSIFFTNPFFLHFCLWFLYSDQKHLVLSDKNTIREKLRNYVLKRFKSELILSDIAAFYPVLDAREVWKNKDKGLLSFLEDILSHYSSNKIIIMRPYVPIGWILTSMQPVLKFTQHLLVQFTPTSLIQMDRKLLLRVTCVEGLKHLHIESFDKATLNLVTEHLKYFNVQPHVRFDLKGDADLSHLIRHMDQNSCQSLTISLNGNNCSLTAESRSISIFPQLTKLSFAGCFIGESIVQGLVEASRTGNLPCLSSLSFVQCRGLKTKLPLVFGCQFPNLTHVNMYETDIDNVDVKTLAATQLKSLTLTMNDTIDLASSFKQKNITLQHLFLVSVNHKTSFNVEQLWPQIPNLSKVGFSNISLDSDLPTVNELTFLTCLSLHGCIQGHEQLQMLLAQTPCRNLSFLDLTNSQGISGNLSVLLTQNFSSLNCLILRRCKLNSTDFTRLARANVEGRLPKLKHLDASMDQNLFSFGSLWNDLSSIDIADQEDYTGEKDMLSEITERMSSGCLQSLQDLTCNNNWNHIARIKTSYYQLKILRVHQLTFAGLNTILSAIHERLLPSLCTVCIVSYIDMYIDSNRLQHEAARLLSRVGVSCHDAIPSDDPFVPGRCLCHQANS